MPDTSTPSWTFLTNHALVLLCIAHDPDMRLRDIGDVVGISERATHRIITELDAAGYITRTRRGRRNVYEIEHRARLPDPIARERRVGELLGVLTDSPS